MGGNNKIASSWAANLGLPIEQIENPESVGKLKDMIGNAVASMVTQINKTYNEAQTNKKDLDSK